jgi:hypothetical protein
MISKIVALGGPSYRRDYIPPAMMLVLGVALLIFWCWRIAATKKQS